MYVAGDIGPSGFGEASRTLVEELIYGDDVDVTLRTHFWGTNEEGIHWQNRGVQDTRFTEKLIREGEINPDYMIEDGREIANRDDDLMENLGTNESIPSHKCMVRQFEGQEDVWLAIGGVSFAEQAPDDVYTILSTDYNLDKVPRKWEYHMEMVDEVWVPSKWVKKSIMNRFGREYNVQVMPYGINMKYEPTEYDCEACPHDGTNPRQAKCLRDGNFNFLVISRFYHMKGLYRTVKAYIEEFRPEDSTRLFVKTTSNNQFQFNPMQSFEMIRQELGYPNETIAEIGIAMEPLEHQYLYDLMGHADAFLQLSRAECFGIAQMQAAWCGTPVVHTNWSAQEELLPEDNDGFISVNDYSVEKVRRESNALPFNVGGGYPPDAKWAVPSIEAIQERMREVYEMSQEERDRRGEDARAYIKDNFDAAEAADMVVDRLHEISGRVEA